MVAAVLLLEVADSAERTERALRIDESNGRMDVDDLGLDYCFLAVFDLGHRSDHTKLAVDAAWLLVHLVEGEAVFSVDLCSYRTRGRGLAGDGLVDSGVEDLGVEDGGAAGQPVWV